MQTTSIRSLTLLAVALFTQPALAHFPWLAVDSKGKAILFFGEHIADRTYHMPESIAKATVEQINADGKPAALKLAPVDKDKFVGLVSKDAVSAGSTLASSVTYGIYQGARLNYYMLHYGGKLPTQLTPPAEGAPGLELNARLVDTDSGVDVYVYWQGKPLADAKVQLFCDDGHEEGNAKTDTQGKVSFTDSEVEDGLNGILVGHTVQGEAGDLNGKQYKTVANYLTVSFVDPQ